MSEDNSFPPEQVHAIVMDAGHGPIITKVERVTYMGVPCLKGRGVGLTDELWAHGQVSYVALGHIKSVIIYDSIEAYREAWGRHRIAAKAAAKADTTPAPGS